MYIQKIHIKEFGALRDKEISFSKGINLLEGNNESGKSTILSFIRFMLYGMPRRAAGEIVSERERGLSWENGVAEGSMELGFEGRLYRIERKGHLRGGARETYGETASIIDMETGTEVMKGEIPGKVFLGMSADLFLSTSCIRQLECVDMDSDEINSSIENLLFSADEEIDTQKVQSKLDDLRRALLYKNGKGGKLFELEATKSLLETKLEKAKHTAKEIITKEALAEKLKGISEKAKRMTDEAEEQIRLYETATTLKRFETLHAYEAQYRAQEDEFNRLCREKGYQNTLPDRATLERIDRYASTLNEAVRVHQLSVDKLAQAERASCGDRTLAKFYETTYEAGGKDTLCTTFLRAMKKSKGALLRAVLGFSFGALLLVLGILGLLLEPSFFPLPALSYGILGGGVLLCVLGILSLSVASESKRTIIELVRKIGLPDNIPNVTSLAEHIETCRKNHELCLTYDSSLLDARKELSQNQELLNKTVQDTRRMLSESGVSCETTSTDELSACLRDTHTVFFALCNERERIEGKLSTLRGLIDELKANLKEVNEASLSASIGKRAPSEILEQMDIERLRLAYNYGKTQHALNEQKKIALEKELIALSSTAESPARLDAKLSEVKEELTLNRLKYDAIVMAHEAMNEASERLRRNVTPKLRIRAGELMEKLTGGKYQSLGVSTDMKITVISDHATRSIEALSKGTRDAAYISLRIALAELICADNMPPLMFDESFTQLDEQRTLAMLNMLYDYTANESQSLLFTCHKREGEMLKTLGTFNHIKL